MACFCHDARAVDDITMEPPRLPSTKHALARNNGRFERIPSEKKMYILFFLDPYSVCQFGRCSKSLKEIADDNRVWQWRLKPPEKHEQNGSKENVDVPAKIQYMRTMAPSSLWFYTNAASKFMRNFSSQSSISALLQILDRPNHEDTPYRRFLADRVLENEIVTMLLEDDEWKPPVIGCVATILLGLKGRSSKFPALIQQLWQLVLDTEVADKIVPKLVVAAYFADPHFEKSALDFIAKSVKIIEENAPNSTDEDEADRLPPNPSLASTISSRSEDEKLPGHKNSITENLASTSYPHDAHLSHSSPDLPSSPSPPKKTKPKPTRKPSVKYVDTFCLTGALLTVVEMLKDHRKARAQVNSLLPPKLAALIDHHAYNRTAKSAKEWTQVIKENNAALNIAPQKCVIM